MKALLIHNPTAGYKAGITTNVMTIDQVKSALRGERVVVEVIQTEQPGDGTKLAAWAASRGYGMVVAAGGDGTVCEVAQALVGTDVVLGIIPLGSVMNVARMLHVPRDLAAAARLLHSGRVVRIDVGRSANRYFLEAGGVGIDAGIFAYANQIDAGQWHSLGELLRFVARYQPRWFSLRLDDRAMSTRAMMIVVANGPYYGPGLPLVPQAKLNDHQFSVRIFRSFNKLALLLNIWRIARGQRYVPRVSEYEAQSVDVYSPVPLPTHVDAYPLGSTPVSFQIVPEALAVIAGTLVAGELESLLPAPPVALPRGR